MNPKSRLIGRVLLATVLGACAQAALSQAYPTRTVTIYYPYPPATGDVAIKALTSNIEKKYGQAVIIEPKVGGNEVVSTQAVLTQPPDGYTLGIVSQNFSLNPAVQKVPYGLKDFAPVTQVVTLASPIAVRPDFPARNMAEFIAYAKANPGKINFGTVGNYHKLALLTLAESAGVSVNDVPFKGTPDANAQLFGGHIDGLFMTAGPAFTNAKAGKVKLLAVTTQRRMAESPDVPTAAETVPGWSMSLWLGFVGRAGLPAAVQDFWVREIREASKIESAVKTILSVGFYPVDVAPTPREFTDLIVRETHAMAAAAKKAGISPQ